MNSERSALAIVFLVVSTLLVSSAYADTLELKNGTVIKNCYVKDEGIRLLVWERIDDAGTSKFRVIPRTSLAPRLSEDASFKNKKGETPVDVAKDVPEALERIHGNKEAAVA